MKLYYLPILALTLTSCPEHTPYYDLRSSEQRKSQIDANVKEWEIKEAKRVEQLQKDYFVQFKAAENARMAEEGALQARRDAQAILEVQRQREAYQERQEAIVREYQQTGRDNLEKVFQEAAIRSQQEKAYQHEVNSQLTEQVHEAEMQERAIQAQREFEEDARRFYGR